MTLASRRLLLIWLLALALVKIWLAARLPLFGDEAFYRLEARSLAWAYTDIPPLTPWLIALGRAVGGDHVLALRAPFLLLGLLLPLAMLAWARQFGGSGESRAAVLLAMLLPLSATLGVLALPDVPLTLAWVLLAWALARILRHGRTGDFVLLGLVLAFGWLAHYRFALAYVAVALLLLGAARGRRLMTDSRLWMAQAIGLVGVAPLLAFNWAHDFTAVRFHFVDRHPWRFDAIGLLEPLVQALVATPVLYVALLAAVVAAWRVRGRDAEPNDVLYTLAGSVLLGLVLLAPWLDRERVSFHWSLPGMLLAVPLVPAILRRWGDAGRFGRCAALAAPLLACVATLGWIAMLVHASMPAPSDARGLGRPLPDNLQGWREVGAFARGVRDRVPHEVLIADNFMLAAQLDHALRGGTPVYVLDHPRNARHGRAAQLALWARDEASLQALPQWRRGLLFVEETARREIDRVPAWLAHCDRWRAIEPVDELVLFGGRKRVVALVVARGDDTPPRCRLPSQADFLVPAPAAVLRAEEQDLEGWAIADFVGVARVEVLLDGVAIAAARLDTPFPGVRAQWPMSQDPRHPDVGWRARVDLSGRQGRAWIALRVTDSEGRQRVLAGRWIELRRGP